MTLNGYRDEVDYNQKLSHPKQLISYSASSQHSQTAIPSEKSRCAHGDVSLLDRRNSQLMPQCKASVTDSAILFC